MGAATPLIAKLRDLLASELSGARIDLESGNGSGRVWGVVAWNGFDSLDQVDRQASLWRIIRGSLTPDEQLRISVILTMTPTELTDQ